jgi:hypothetical protein
MNPISPSSSRAAWSLAALACVFGVALPVVLTAAGRGGLRLNWPAAMFAAGFGVMGGR